MGYIEIQETDVMLDDAAAEAEKNREAADDLRRMEEDIRAEAEASVEDFDDEGDKRRSVAAASAAFDFDAAELETERIEREAERYTDLES